MGRPATATDKMQYGLPPVFGLSSYSRSRLAAGSMAMSGAGKQTDGDDALQDTVLPPTLAA